MDDTNRSLEASHMATWDSFWAWLFLFLIVIPFCFCWGFAFIDVFRRHDLNGWMKALWLLCIIFLPILGTLIYLVCRPQTADEYAYGYSAPYQAAPAPNYGGAPSNVVPYTPTTTAEQLRMLADLHDAGKLTDAEFDNQKARLLAA
jgi:hypothetical protein